MKRARVQGTRGSSKTVRAVALASPCVSPFNPPAPLLPLARVLPTGARARVRFLKQPRTYAPEQTQQTEGRRRCQIGLSTLVDRLVVPSAWDFQLRTDEHDGPKDNRLLIRCCVAVLGYTSNTNNCLLIIPISRQKKF